MHRKWDVRTGEDSVMAARLVHGGPVKIKSSFTERRLYKEPI